MFTAVAAATAFNSKANESLRPVGYTASQKKWPNLRTLSLRRTDYFLIILTAVQNTFQNHNSYFVFDVLLTFVAS